MTTETKERTSKTDNKADGLKPELPENAPPKPTMPYVEVGQGVRWYMDGTRGYAPHAAIVTGVYHNSLRVMVMNPEGSYRLEEGVKHVDDPTMKEHDKMQGAWEHTKRERKILEFLDTQWEYNPSTNQWE